MDTIYIDRSRKSDTLRVNTLIQQALDRGDAVHVFAESRIAHDGQVHDFKPALLEPAVSRGLPVHYAALSYRTDPGSPAAAEAVVWGDDISFLKHLANLLALPRVYALVAFGDRPIAGTDRKSLAEALCNAVRAQYVPIDTIPPTHGGPAQGL